MQWGSEEHSSPLVISEVVWRSIDEYDCWPLGGRDGMGHLLLFIAARSRTTSAANFVTRPLRIRPRSQNWEVWACKQRAKWGERGSGLSFYLSLLGLRGWLRLPQVNSGFSMAYLSHLYPKDKIDQRLLAVCQTLMSSIVWSIVYCTFLHYEVTLRLVLLFLLA